MLPPEPSDPVTVTSAADTMQAFEVYRKQRNRKLAGVARRAGHSANIYGEWRRGDKTPNLRTFFNFARALGFRVQLVPEK